MQTIDASNKQTMQANKSQCSLNQSHIEWFQLRHISVNARTLQLKTACDCKQYGTIDSNMASKGNEFAIIVNCSGDWYNCAFNGRIFTNRIKATTIQSFQWQ